MSGVWNLIPWNGLVSGLFSVISALLLGFYANRRLKKLETDLQKEMSNFSKYTEKKHEQYHLLWVAVGKAISDIYVIWKGYSLVGEYPEFSTEAEVEEFLKKHGYKQAEIRWILDEFRENENKAIEKLRYIYDFKARGTVAQKSYQEFRERFFIAEIYLSDEVKRLAQEINEKIWDLLANLYHRMELADQLEYYDQREFRKEQGQIQKESKEILQEIFELREKLMDQMKKELMGLR